MKYDLKAPCDGCPFLKEGGVKFLGAARAKEIAASMASSQGSSFACHKTVDYGEDGEGRETPESRHCAGALIFMEKVNLGGTQLIRIMERIGMYDRTRLTGADRVFDSVREFVAAQKRMA